MPRLQRLGTVPRKHAHVRCGKLNAICEGDRLRRIAENFLSFSRLDRGMQVPDHRAEALGSLRFGLGQFARECANVAAGHEMPARTPDHKMQPRPVNGHEL